MTVTVAQLVGRDAVIARLEALIEAARSGSSGVLVLSAPPGHGKTALLSALEARLPAGTCVLRATGIEPEQAVPFAALDALVRPVLAHLDALPRAQGAALEQALALAPGGGAVSPFAIGAALTSLLGAAAEDEPVVCLVDDLQWVDEASLAAIVFAARRLRTESVAMVLAARTEWDDPALRGLDAIELPPLDEGAGVDLLTGVVGGHLPADVARRVARAAGGAPLDLLEVAAALTPEQRDGRETLVGPPPGGRSASTAFAGRVRALPDPARRALLLVAAGEDAAPDELHAALATVGLGPGDLVAAEEAGLLVLDGGRVVLRHPLVRVAAYHDAAPAERRWAHEVIAGAVPHDDPRRAWHRAAATTAPDEELAAELEAHAAAARTRSAYGTAARAARRAAEVTPERDEAARRLLLAAALFEEAGAFREADLVLDEVEQAGARGPQATRLRGMRAAQVLRQGRPHDARALLLAHAAELREDDPEGAALALVSAVYACVSIGDRDGWHAHAADALALAPPDAPTRLVAAAVHAAGLVAVGRVAEGLSDADAVVTALLDQEGPISGPLTGFGILAQSLVYVERHEAAERLLGRLLRDARATSAVSALPSLLAIQAILDVDLGRWQAAQARAEEAAELAEVTGQAHYVASATGVRAKVLAHRGDLDAAERLAQETLELAAASAPRLAITGHWVLGDVALARGDVPEAVNRLRAATEVHAASGFLARGVRVWEPALIEALIRMGEEREAEALLERWEALGRELGRSYVQATAARCRGLLAGDDAFEEPFAEALAHHARLRMPAERAYTLLCLGERRRRARRRAEAREPLREALDVFAELGAEQRAARARTELRAAGGTAPAAFPKATELTAHELQVALMVAEGRTNKEVAAALFLAPKTIEHHLSAIFRKLGVRRRTELGRLFADELAQA